MSVSRRKLYIKAVTKVSQEDQNTSSTDTSPIPIPLLITHYLLRYLFIVIIFFVTTFMMYRL